MAVPKRKTSRQRGATRFAQWKLSAPSLSECPNCRELKANHQVCKKCGYYDGEKKVEVKETKNK